MNRTYYEHYFAPYPDVVTVEQFRAMLGGIGEVQARRLLREGYIKHYRIGRVYHIPKSCVIDYVLSTHYAKYRHQLKAQIP